MNQRWHRTCLNIHYSTKKNKIIRLSSRIICAFFGVVELSVLDWRDGWSWSSLVNGLLRTPLVLIIIVLWYSHRNWIEKFVRLFNFFSSFRVWHWKLRVLHGCDLCNINRLALPTITTNFVISENTEFHFTSKMGIFDNDLKLSVNQTCKTQIALFYWNIRGNSNFNNGRNSNFIKR